jgi:hypothetical protein
LPVVDLPDKIADAASGSKEDRRQSILRSEDRSTTVPAWHGTILPKTDGDIWLAAAFAEYEKIVALDEKTNGHPSTEDHDHLGLELFAHRSNYLAAARIRGDVPLAKIRSENGRDDWYRIASGKGVLVLHELRRVVGAKEFQEIMDGFGRKNAGKQVTTAEFTAHVEKAAGAKVKGFFAYWLTQTGLPTLALLEIQDKTIPNGRLLTGEIRRHRSMPPSVVTVVVETAEGEQSIACPLPADEFETPFFLAPKGRAQRVSLDKYATAARANGGVFSVLSFHHEPDQTLIVYGTGDEESANRETAEAVQEAVRTSWCNCTLTIQADREVKDDELKRHHLLLIGRPDANSVVRRFEGMLPISFAPRSFVVRNEAYAHAGSGVIVAAENPLQPRFSVVVLAGLSAEATTRLPGVLLKKDQRDAEAIVVPHGGEPKLLVLPAKELVKELK